MPLFFCVWMCWWEEDSGHCCGGGVYWKRCKCTDYSRTSGLKTLTTSRGPPPRARPNDLRALQRRRRREHARPSVRSAAGGNSCSCAAQATLARGRWLHQSRTGVLLQLLTLHRLANAEARAAAAPVFSAGLSFHSNCKHDAMMTEIVHSPSASSVVGFTP